MKKKIAMLFTIALIIAGGYKVVSAASQVFYDYKTYSIASGKITSSAIMKDITYERTIAWLKVDSTTSGTQYTRFVSQALDNHEIKWTYQADAPLNIGKSYYWNVGFMRGYTEVKMLNYASSKDGPKYAGWEGQLKYLSSDVAMS